MVLMSTFGGTGRLNKSIKLIFSMYIFLVPLRITGTGNEWERSEKRNYNKNYDDK